MADGEADWENEDFEPPVIKKPILHTDRWEGEDEDEDVKDNWDDDDEEKEEKSEKSEQTTAVQPKKKKTLAQIIAEKEEKRKKEIEEKLKLLEHEKLIAKDLTPQEKLAQKLKQQKLQEEADLELAKETFGVSDSVQGIDQMQPSSKDDFDNFRKLLVEKIQKFEESPHFVSFLEDFCRELCLNVNPDDIKKITSSLNALAHEKQKVQKAKAGKKKSKKATLNIGKDDYTIMDYADEFEDCI